MAFKICWTVFPWLSALGDSCTRWATVGRKTSFTSPGTTKSLPRSWAMALAMEAMDRLARGLAPRLSSSELRVAALRDTR